MSNIEKMENRITEEILFRTLAFSIAGIFLCMIGLVGTTWAWFTAQIDLGPNTLKCADYAVQMEIVNDEDQSVIEDGIIEAGTYTLHLVMEIDEEVDAEGYCAVKITYGENDVYVFYTDKLKNKDEFSFPLVVDEEVSVNVAVSPCWGELPQFEESEGDLYINAYGLHVTDSGVEKMSPPEENSGEQAGEENEIDNSDSENENGEVIGESVEETVDETLTNVSDTEPESYADETLEKMPESES